MKEFSINTLFLKVGFIADHGIMKNFKKNSILKNS